jgi:hypothetical protein
MMNVWAAACVCKPSACCLRLLCELMHVPALLLLLL